MHAEALRFLHLRHPVERGEHHRHEVLRVLPHPRADLAVAAHPAEPGGLPGGIDRGEAVAGAAEELVQGGAVVAVIAVVWALRVL